MNIAINWVTVLIAAVVNMAVGWIWYGPLFGKMWKGMMGFTDESMKSMKMKPMNSMVGGFIASLVVAYVLAYFIGIAGTTTAEGACQLAFWIWLGFLATNALDGYLWEGKPFNLFILKAVEQVVAIVLMAVVLVKF